MVQSDEADFSFPTTVTDFSASAEKRLCFFSDVL